MSLKDHDAGIKSEYRSLIDNVVQDFYIPLLQEANSYKRAVGFFSSTSLVEISKGIGSMAERGGHIQIVASPYLSDEDVDAIRKGYEDRDKVIEGALIRSLSDDHTDYYSMQRLNLLAALIADGILDIRIAYTEDKAGIGMYHEKMGVIEDEEGCRVAFSGSMNESHTAMAVNYETIDVFCSWREGSDADRVSLKGNAFYSIWNDSEPNIKVREFPAISDVLIEKYRKNPPNFGIDNEQFANRILTYAGGLQRVIQDAKPVGARIPKDVTLHDYQQEAISVWVGENYRGIFDMATGTGKTFTGLGAISKLSEDLNDELAVVIVCPYQHLVEQWVEDIVRFNINPIHKKEQYYTMYPILKQNGCLDCDEVWSCKKIRKIIEDKLECTNEQTEDVILQALPFYSYEELSENVFEESEDVFEKHTSRLQKRFEEVLTVEDDIGEIYHKTEMRRAVEDALNTLKDREKKVIRDRFGFDIEVEKTLEEVGADFGVTRERVRQIEAKAIRKLQHKMQNNNYYNYMN